MHVAAPASAADACSETRMAGNTCDGDSRSTMLVVCTCFSANVRSPVHSTASSAVDAPLMQPLRSKAWRQRNVYEVHVSQPALLGDICLVRRRRALRQPLQNNFYQCWPACAASPQNCHHNRLICRRRALDAAPAKRCSMSVGVNQQLHRLCTAPPRPTPTRRLMQLLQSKVWSHKVLKSI